MYYLMWNEEGREKSQVCEGYIERFVLEEELEAKGIQSICCLVEEVLAERA